MVLLCLWLGCKCVGVCLSTHIQTTYSCVLSCVWVCVLVCVVFCVPLCLSDNKYTLVWICKQMISRFLIRRMWRLEVWDVIVIVNILIYNYTYSFAFRDFIMWIVCTCNIGMYWNDFSNPIINLYLTLMTMSTPPPSHTGTFLLCWA